MKAKEENGNVKIFGKLPNRYKGVENVISGYNQRTDLHEKDGFFDLVIPELRENERTGALIKVDNYYTYEIEEIPPRTEAEIEEQMKAEKKIERDELLRKGIIVGGIWFNEEKLTQFTVMAQMCQSNGVPGFEWGKEDGWNLVSVEEAFQISMEASNEFSKIYKDFQ